MLKRLIAYLRLALRAVVLHPLRVLFTPPDRRGKAGFLASYAGEGLVPYSAEERASLPRFGGCINCGVCDAICPLVFGARPGKTSAVGSGPGAEVPIFRGPSFIALAWSRASPELRALRGELSALDGCGSCSLCRDACPRGVPLLDIFRFTRRKLEEVEAATRRPA